MRNKKKKPGTIERIKDRFLRKTDPQEAAEKMAIDYITILGTLGDRLEALRGIDSDDELLSATKGTLGAMLPYLNLAGDNIMFARFEGFLDSYRLYSETKDFIDLTWGELDENGVLKGRGGKDVLEKKVSKYSLMMEKNLQKEAVELAKVLIGLSFEKIEQYKTIVISKPVFMVTGKPQNIKTGGGYNQGDKPDA